MAEKRTVNISELKHFEGVKAIRNAPKPTDKDWAQFVVDYCDSIEQVGLLDWGISVVQRDDGFYVVNGNRRITALKYNLGLQYSEVVRPNTAAQFPEGTIEVQVLPADEFEVLLMQAIANTKSQKATPKQIMSIIVQLLNAKWTLDTIAQKMCLTLQTVEKYLKLNLLPEDVVNEIESGAITIQNGLALTTLPRDVLDPENGAELATWVEKAKDMNNDEFAAETAKEIKVARAARKGGEKKTQFTPEAKLLSKEELAKRFAQAETAFTMNPEDVEARVRYEVMKEIFSLDEKTVEANRVAFEQATKEAEEKAAGKKKEKAQKDAVANLDNLVAMGAMTQAEADEMKAKITAMQTQSEDSVQN